MSTAWEPQVPDDSDESISDSEGSYPRLQDCTALTEAERAEKIKFLCRSLILSDDVLRRVMSSMKDSMKDGLSKERSSTAAVKMLPSYVRAVPNGSEEGDYLALDLGGTKFRLVHIRLKGCVTEAESTEKLYRIPKHLLCGCGEDLFEHVVACLAKFMEENNLKSAMHLPLGFTFPFPCKQEGLTRARLSRSTKGFDVIDGADVVTLLREACARRKDISIDVVAVLNDTVGTLMACAFKENTCQVGVVVGTGTNACYIERLWRNPKLAGEIDSNDGLPDEMIINTEWGAFGDYGATHLGFVQTRFDKMVDERSKNRRKQLFEKMISGMGEVVHMVLIILSRHGILLPDHLYALTKNGHFPAKFVSDIESDLLEEEENRSFQKTLQILEDIGINDVSTADCANVAYVCSLVSTRAAHLTGSGIATLLNHMDSPRVRVKVGVAGSVFRNNPFFRRRVDQKIAQLVDTHIKYELVLSEDGSGRGAALVAAVATRIKQERERSATA